MISPSFKGLIDLTLTLFALHALGADAFGIGQCGAADQRICTSSPFCEEGLVRDGFTCRTSALDCGHFTQRACGLTEQIPPCNSRLEVNLIPVLNTFDIFQSMSIDSAAILQSVCLRENMKEDILSAAKENQGEAEKIATIAGDLLTCITPDKDTWVANRNVGDKLKELGLSFTKKQCYLDTVTNIKNLGYKTLTLGVAASVDFKLGFNFEQGVAIDLYNPAEAMMYATTGYASGLSFGAGFGPTVGFATVEYNQLAGAGYGSVYGVGDYGVGFEYNYEKLARLVFSKDFGVGLEAGVTYVKSYTLQA